MNLATETKSLKLLFCITQQARGTREVLNILIPTPVKVFSCRTESINQTSLDCYPAAGIHTILVHTFKLCEKFSDSDISPKNLNLIPFCWFKNSIGSKIWWNLKLAREHGGQGGIEETGWSFQTGGFNKEEAYLEQPQIIRSPGSHSLDQLSKLIMAWLWKL